MQETKLTTTVSVRALSSLCNPLEKPPWTGAKSSITVDEVTSRIQCQELIDPSNAKRNGQCTREEHVSRIAWLVVNKDEKPIHLTPDGGRLVSDGNHRFAAALCRDDETVRVYITGRPNTVDRLLKKIDTLR